MSPDVHALTGAYVLDAVSELERASFERHLAECGACAQEVNELKETTARLGRAAEVEPPAYLKGQVLAKISQVRQLPRIEPGPAHRRREPSRWALRLTTAAAAVLLVVATAFGILLFQERSKSNDLEAYANSVSSLLQCGDAKVNKAQTPSGTATLVACRSQNRAMALTGGMAPLPDGKIYQAWLVPEEGPAAATSAGRIASDSRLSVDNIGGAKAFAVTIEPAPGSQHPTSDPIMTISFPV